MEDRKDAKKRIRNDILLAAAMIVLSVALIITYRAISDDGTHAAVIIDGKESGVYLLSEDTEALIETKHGTNLLVIKDGKAKVTDADCPDLVCVRHREIWASGESIVCLPHRLVIEIRD
ncbi:MAG: NusG domain II-containing protein [Clostridia bacterium]|nr:NusG domain II-containing protein [Clostridia bacterium]